MAGLLGTTTNGTNIGNGIATIRSHIGSALYHYGGVADYFRKYSDLHRSRL